MNLEMFPISNYEDDARSDSTAGNAPVKNWNVLAVLLDPIKRSNAQSNQMPFSSLATRVRSCRHLLQLAVTLLCISLRREKCLWTIHNSAGDQVGLVEQERALWHRLHEQYCIDGRGDVGEFLD